MAWHLFMTAQLIRSAAGFCCSVQPASYSYHHQLFLLFRTNEKLWGRLYSPPSRGKSSFQRPQSYAVCITDWCFVVFVFFFSYKYAAKDTLQKASCMQSNMKKYRTKAVTSILGTISSPTDPRSFLADLLHSIFGIVILQQWNPCPEFLDDIKCPFAAVDYLIYYFHHSIPAKSIKSKPSVILEEQTQPWKLCSPQAEKQQAKNCSISPLIFSLLFSYGNRLFVSAMSHAHLLPEAIQ